MTFEQIVEIPADRRLIIEVPHEIPVGKIVLVFKPVAETPAADKPAKLRFSRKELDLILQNAKTPHTDALTGILAHLGDITIEQIREERLAKYLP